LDSPNPDLIKQAVHAVDQYEHQQTDPGSSAQPSAPSPARSLKDSMQSLITELQTLLVPLQDHLFYTPDPSAHWQAVPTIALWWIDDWATDPEHILTTLATPGGSATAPESEGPRPWLTLTLDIAHPGQWIIHPDGDYPEPLTFPPVIWDESTDRFALPSTEILTYAARSIEWRTQHPSRTVSSPPAVSMTTRRCVGWSLGIQVALFVLAAWWLSYARPVSWPLWALLLLGGLLGVRAHHATIRWVRESAPITTIPSRSDSHAR